MESRMTNRSSRRLDFVRSILLCVGMIGNPGHAFNPSRTPLPRISPSCSRNIVLNIPQRNMVPTSSTIRKPDILCLANRRSVQLTSMPNDNHANNSRRFRLRQCILTAVEKFKSRPSAYLLIPVIAAFVGWFTNYLAVQMIFYPIEFRGIPIWRKDELPLGLIGWQGIVPCKTRVMSETMVNMVTTQLLNIEEVFRRLDPDAVAEILSPEVPKLMHSIGSDMSPVGWLPRISKCFFFSLPMKTLSTMSTMNHKFLHDFTVAMQDNIGALLNVKNCVVHQMMEDRALLGELFRKCGQKELDFLTNSGLWFGFLLGLIQMIVALFWENPWASPIGGTIVGLATNWLALKWIFEPVNPTKFGPFILQGQFLRRQKEVAAEFSSFFAKNVLTSEKLWDSILNDLTTKPSFDLLFKKHLKQFANGLAGGFGLRLPSQLFNHVASLAVEKLPNHLHVLHPYVDKTLNLQSSLRTQMEKMTSAKFERVLHPIFEEDEHAICFGSQLTLIVAGGVLGFIAGLIQGGIESGEVQKWVGKTWKRMRDFIRRERSE
ncbi:hypothetical protein ACHAW6_015612 [Cyclotella cf. meneghiniana]